jgi:hypothetical protein
MSDSSTAPGGARPARTPKEEPDLWQEDDIPTDDAGSDGSPGAARDEERGRETPARQNESPRE